MEDLKTKANHIADVLLIIGDNVQGKEDLRAIVYDVLKDNVINDETLRKKARTHELANIFLAASLVIGILLEVIKNL